METVDNSGHLGYLTSTEEKTFNDVKSLSTKIAMDNWHYDISFLDDYDFLRFCRARKFDLKKTLEMIFNWVRWRLDEKVDTIEVFFASNNGK